MLLKEQILYLEKKLMTYTYKELNEHLSDDFLEFGSSGNVFDKNVQLDEARNDHALTSPIQYTVNDFHIKLLAPDVVLATYRTMRHNDHKNTIRSSIWKCNDGKWQMVFHQGTPTQTS
ncbi:DUF4440 domain-containing protein [Bacillus sp. JCM 19034]|uniref:nuclear transport factor 2 family protein n=1 Tax=Bacillus sp. JCM 19034 TaxID=1481928 RepID=UPI0009E783C5|nr:DUF4440 domain-containing protein [Bacillus sp. JCM 19034]